MIGILIITHEAIGDAYRGLAQHFFPGDAPANVKILGVTQEQQHEEIIGRTQTLIQELNCHDGVLVMTDIFGATPCNAARKLVREGRVAMLTGLNAPMMVKAIQYSPAAADLTAFTQSVKAAAINGILDITTPPDESC
ncbi:PTS mannose transporter subunit IIA [Uruburuella testudinis]|uniref:PTS mannose transporter subunit IIA n=1 Tax=Uruburuella testudinis TaxID=1282863 RepID=A0ABY4DV68_9NEIS|nr:PTS mannose transporter subunit IIA [Uruburuella testudinis]UOO81507.1 PTS mannose transporter subunit IIA [Uruburuella testudinis]